MPASLMDLSLQTCQWQHVADWDRCSHQVMPEAVVDRWYKKTFQSLSARGD